MRHVFVAAIVAGSMLAAGAAAADEVTLRGVSSFAQGTARAGSDIDILVIRPDSVDDDHQGWHAALEEWRQYAGRLTGNRIELLEIGTSDASRLLRSRRPLWSDIRRHGVVVHGRNLDELAGRRSA